MNTRNGRNARKLAVVLCGLLAVGVLAVGQYTQVVKATDDEWEIVSNGGLTPVSGVLFGVSATAADDVWAVGYNGGNSLIRHWTGSVWSTVSSPNPGSSGNVLNAVAAIDDDDAWAVGYYYSSSGALPDLSDPWNEGYGEYALIVHWNGTSWSQVTTPQPSNGTQVVLNDVAAVSSTDVWAVGNYYNTSESLRKTLIMRYTGSSWSIVSSPSPGTYSNYLHGVAAIPDSGGNMWAVGYQSSGSPYTTLILFWDNSEGLWSTVNSPNPSSNRNYLQEVTALSDDDAWSVGGQKESSLDPDLTLTLYWDGSSWTYVSSPDPSGDVRKGLWGVSARASDYIWAVGWYRAGGLDSTLAELWDGTEWSIVTTPNQGSDDNALYDVTALPGGACEVRYSWAVGAYTDTGPVIRPLTMRYTQPADCQP